MIDLSKYSATQLMVLKAVAEFNCGNLECCDCPFENSDNGCGSMKLERAFYHDEIERRESDKA